MKTVDRLAGLSVIRLFSCSVFQERDKSPGGAGEGSRVRERPERSGE